ncbi:MAG: ParB/RepB/Spo0J family partition protein [Chloroflexi bacterium]|nr:ParB/RepB/Spo0J family partition protein [Chloroflexota bacterium]
MSSSKFSRNMKGKISSMANWSGGKPEEEDDAPQAFGEKLRQEMELASVQVPIQELELELLVDNPYQHLARRSFDDESVEELVDSIKSNGFYGALLARRKVGVVGQFELAYGHRRKEAARRAGLKAVPVKVLELNDTEMARIMASENFSRLDLNPLGEAGVVGFLADQQNLSAREISVIIGKKRGWIESRLALHNAPPTVKKMVEQKPETFSHVPLLLRVRENDQRLNELIQQIMFEELTVQQLRVQVEQGRVSRETTPSVNNPRTPVQSNKANIVTKITNSSLPGNSDKNHNQAEEIGDQPLIKHNGKVVTNAAPPLAEIAPLPQVEAAPSAELYQTIKDEAADIEAELALLEKVVAQLIARKPESLSWNIRSRLQRVSQTLKDLVGGD